MDTYTAGEIARSLDTSTPRVVRAARRLGFSPPRNGRMALTREMAERLRETLGHAPRVAGLTTTEVKVLAALARAPLGLCSARVVAGQAGVSPTAAANALRSLERKDLMRKEETVIAAGRARSVKLLHANRRAKRWLELAPLLTEVAPPQHERPRQRVVPPRLRHLFWNTAPAQMNVAHAGPYIAHRLLSTMDFDGLAWGASSLRRSDWERAATVRGLDEWARALARNLALAERG